MMPDYRLLYEEYRAKYELLAAGMSPDEIERATAATVRMISHMVSLSAASHCALGEVLEAMHDALRLLRR